jgi:hypothetical protein
LSKPPARRGDRAAKGQQPPPVLAEPQVEHLAAIVLQRVEQKIEQHLHLPITMPDLADLEQMREKTPEAYEAYLRMVEERSATDAYVDKARYDLPFKLAKRGQGYGLAALIAVLIFCGYVAQLGTTTAQVVAGIIAALDLVAIIATLMNTNNGDGSASGA